MKKIIILFLFPCCIYAGVLTPQRNVTEKSHKVHVDIRDQLAITTVTQVFESNALRNLEMMYKFSIPPSAKIHHLSMWVNGVEMLGAIVEKNKASKIYEEITKAKRDPALLEYLGNGNYQIKVFPVQPHKQQKIKMVYWQNLEYDSGVVQYKYLLEQEKSRKTHFKLTANVFSSMKITQFDCPTHKNKRKVSSSKVKMRIEHEEMLPSNDVEFYYKVKCEDWRMDFCFFRPDPKKDGYFTAFLTPPQKKVEVMSKAVTFVLDTSGSMLGEKITQAKKAISYGVKSLNETDTFNIIAFESEISSFSDKRLTATNKNKQDAQKFISNLHAMGSTNISAALKQALAVKTLRPHMVVFITDGKPTTGETNRDILLKNIKHQENTRLFTFGVGLELDVKLLKGLAQDNKGLYFYIPKQLVELKLSRFFNKVSSPVLSNISLDLTGAKAHRILPEVTTELFAGSQIVFTGKFSKYGRLLVNLIATTANTKIKIEKHINFPQETMNNRVVKKLWMSEQIDFLIAAQQKFPIDKQSAELRNEIIRLSKEVGIVTPYTSYLVLEKDEDYRTWDIKMHRYEDPVVKEPRGHVKSTKSVKTNLALGGSNGAFGSRFGGKKNMLKVGGGINTNNSIVAQNLQRLADMQCLDGSWEHNVKSTSLVILCFLHSGSSWVRGQYKTNVKKAVRFLRDSQQSQGSFSNKALIEHIIATFAMVEVYSSSNYNPILRSCINKALRYMTKNNKTEISEVAWAAMTLFVAKKFALVAESFSLDKMENFVVVNLDKNYYRMPKSSAVDVKTATAMAMSVLLFCDYSNTHEYLAGGVAILDNNKPNLEKNIDLEYGFWGSLAMYKMKHSYDVDGWREAIARVDYRYIQKILSNNNNSVENIAFITLTLQIQK
ncbi:VIT domain-containing protein [Candidatus Uabimicrobium sp. HlEnr_7]|uniref:VIT domain-containing protein n=1 Tax=Candidatus Uabimicrobium helgolandensis TaxID=3095367 RepID=UPI00355784F2